MKTIYIRFARPAVALLTLFVCSAWSAVPASEAEQLGKNLTCFGAEMAGNKSGSIPEFSGKWLGTPPHVTFKGPGTPYDNPYATEKPLYTITAENMSQHVDKLTEGTKTLLQKYPKSYKVVVYPSHRDFRFPDWRCANSRENALKAELTDDGLGIKAVRGTAAFPIPKSGLELVWNQLLPPRAAVEDAIMDQAVVYPSGKIAWGRVDYKIFALSNDQKSPKETTGVSNYFNVKTLAPERNKGEIIVGQEGFNYKTDARVASQYSPGTRRVRLLPAFGFDMPQGPGGFRTVDDDRMFNGTPERYNWTIVGKKEVLIPYNNYRMNDQSMKYDELLKPGHPNPDAIRFELHRVWVLQAVLKEGFRHQYAKRVV